MTDELLFEVRDSIGYITFNRPQSRNAITLTMYDRLADIVAETQQSEHIRALILSGSGDKAFAAGTEIASFQTLTTAQDAIDYERQMDRVLGVLETVKVPTIAAINGACTGGGAAIALCCDFRIANAEIKFGFPIAKTLGNCLSVTNISRLSQAIGAARTKDLLFSARLIRSEEALQIGLVNQVVPDPMESASSLAETLKQHAPLTMQATKMALFRLREQQAANIDSDDLVVQCYTSEDFKEGVSAFLSKRQPQWKGH